MNKIDSSILKHAHTEGVVQRSIDSVNTNGVGAQFLKKRNVTLAASFVGKRIGVSSSGARVGVHILLVCDTANEEFGTVLVEEMGALIGESVCISTPFTCISHIQIDIHGTYLDDNRREISSGSRRGEKGAGQCCSSR